MARFGLALGGGGCRSGRGGSRGRTTVAAGRLAAGRAVSANPAAADLAARLAATRLAATNLLHLAARLAAARLTSRRAGRRSTATRLAATNLLHLAARLAACRGTRRSARRRSTNGRLTTRRGTGAMEQARLGRGAEQQNQGPGSHQRENDTTVHGHTPLCRNGRLPTLGSWIGFPHHQSTTAIGPARRVLLTGPPLLAIFRSLSGRLCRICLRQRNWRIWRRLAVYRLRRPLGPLPPSSVTYNYYRYAGLWRRRWPAGGNRLPRLPLGCGMGPAGWPRKDAPGP